MFRKLLTLAVLVTLTFECIAQNIHQGSFSPLMNCRAATVIFDFDNTKVEGAPIKDIIDNEIYENGASYADDFDKDKREIIADFIEEFNETNCPILLTVSQNPEILMTVVVKETSRKGNSVQCEYVFTSKTNPNEVLLSISMLSKDGHIGSFTNLLGDAFERAGKDLGKYIKKQIRKAAKQ